MRILFAVLRVCAAVVYLVAVGTQLWRSIGLWVTQTNADVQFLVVGFFSYFTMETGIAAAVVLVLSALTIARARRMPGPLAIARGLMVTYTATTALAYNLLLRPIEVPDGSSEPWANEWLHVWGPVYLLLDFALAPDRRRLPWRTLWIAVAFPVVWAVYTFVRGPFATDTRFGSHWYPYPFLNPDTGGWPSAILYVVILSALIVGLSAIVVLLSRIGSRREHSDPPRTTGRRSKLGPWSAPSATG